MRLVSNASPLIFLTKIDLLGLLQQCFQQTRDAATSVAKLEALVQQHGLYLSERLLDETRQMLAGRAPARP